MTPTVPVLAIPEIRDYEKINAELGARLDEGHRRIRLTGAEGQRFLAAGLTGSWAASVEIEGRAGPELAAGLEAPHLTVVCHGSAGDGAARGFRAGRLIVLGPVDVALGYAMEGGIALAAGGAGARAGLNQKGGVLIVLGPLGQLAGERQSGGWLFASPGPLGPHAGRGQRGGRLVELPSDRDAFDRIDRSAAETLSASWRELGPWLPPGMELSSSFPAGSA